VVFEGGIALRILYFTSTDVSLPNGPGVNEREFILAGLASQECTFFAVVPRPERNFDLPISDRVTLIHPHQRRRLVPYMIHSVALFSTVRSLIRRFKVDLLVCRPGALPLADYWLSKVSPRPLAIFSSGEHLDLPEGIRSRLAYWPHKVMFESVLRRAVAVDFPTPQIWSEYCQLFPRNQPRFRCIENATNTERFFPFDTYEARRTLQIPCFDPVVGFAGGSPWERGGQIVVEAVASLKPKFPRLGGIVVGGGKRLDSLRQRAEKLGVAENCLFTGSVSYEAVNLYINAFDLGLSFDRPERAAKIGNSSQKVRQYLACGKPVVFQGYGNGFLTEHGFGQSVDIDDLPATCTAIEHWLALPREQKNQIALEARQFAVEHLSAKDTFRQRLSFWQHSLDQLTEPNPAVRDAYRQL